MEITQQELLQIIGEKELKIYSLQKENARLIQLSRTLEMQLGEGGPGRKKGINAIERFSQIKEDAEDLENIENP